MKRERLIIFLLLSAVGAFLLLYRLDTLPLRLWDEGRRAVNALEMSQGKAHFLVPTFAGQPDHWGTKPPLLVWLQAFAYKIIEPGVLAVRLPAALAAMGTLWAMLVFTIRHFGHARWGLAAGLCLLSVPVYLGSHAARAGDFDALLALWTTLMLLSLYRYLETRKLTSLSIASLCFALALWTKGIAGGFFLPGIALWTLLYRPHRFVWREWRVYLALLLPVLSLVSYYLLRATVDPGFLTILWENEIGGRYGTALEGHAKAPWFYLRLLFFQPWPTVWTLLLLPALGLLWRKAAYRRFGGYLFCLIFAFLLLISSAGTKLFWYTMPLYPLFALLIGGGLTIIFERWHRTRPQSGWVYVLFTVLIFAWPLYQSGQRIAVTDHGDDYRSITVYGTYLKTLTEVPEYTVLLPSYNSNAIFAAALAKLDGQQVHLRYLRQPEPQIHPGVPVLETMVEGSQVVVCEMSTWLHMDRTYTFTELYARSPCKLLRVTGQQ